MNHLNIVAEKALTNIKPGTTVKVLKLLGGERFKDKLLCMTWKYAHAQKLVFKPFTA